MSYRWRRSRVGQDLVRLVGLLEAGRRVGILVDVGVPLLGELAEGALDLGVAGAALDAQRPRKIALVVAIDGRSLREAGRGRRPGRALRQPRARPSTAVEHRLRQRPGERVLLARVVRAEERDTARPRPRRRARSAACAPSRYPCGGEDAQGGVPAERPEGERSRARRRAGASSRRGTARTRRAPRWSACCPVARSGRRPRCTRRVRVRPSSARRDAGRSASPARWSAAHRKSPEASPVNTRPVRLPPCAAGASPTSRIRASGSPKPGTGRAQYVSSRKRATFSSATSSRHATSRGHRRHSIDLGRQGGERRPIGAHRLLEQELVEPPRRRPQPEEPHHEQVGDVEQEDRRDRPDRERPDEVHALVQRRELDDRPGARSG